MKTNYLFLAAVATVLLSPAAKAQDTTAAFGTTIKPFAPATSYRTWSIGIHGGALSPVAFIGKNDFSQWKVDFGYGAYVKKQILPAFALKANFLAGKLRADNSKALGNGSQPNSPYSSFVTKLKWSGSLEGEVNLANINWMNRKGFVQPFISGGAGLIGYSTTLTDRAGVSSEYTPGKTIQELFIPVGAGLRFNVSPDINLSLGYTVNLVDGDNVDGYHNGPQNDKFSYGHVGLEFALGKKSKPQLAASNPVAAMEYDYMTRNEELSRQLSSERARNAAAMDSMRQQLNKFMTDQDKDGVSDYFDKCAGTGTNVKVDGSGCPLPESKNVTKVITAEDRRVVKEAIENLEFDFGKSTIRQKSFASLDRVAELLVQKNFSLKLAGHTDNVGSAEANLRLSKARAEAVRQYLVSRGANASRIEATGYGESQPIASNKTDAGRQQNRRVEFTLY